MSLQHSTEVKRIDVVPELGGMTNFIKRVVLEITFTDPELAHPVESKTMMVALLSPSDDMSETFVQVDDLTDSQIATWAFDYHGGEENFIGMVSESHTQALELKLQEFGIKMYDRETGEIVEDAEDIFATLQPK